jgi:mannose-1-phosphate guanylyltransferase
MEKTASGAVVMLDAAWCDVGSWHALWDVLPKDVDANVVRGDVLCENTHGCYINAGSRLVCTLGVDDLVIVDSPDAVLVARRSDSEKIKTIVDRLKKAGNQV